MAIPEIKFSNITDGSGVDGTGYFDIAMKSLGLHIDEALKKQRITQSGAGEVYAQAIPAIMEQALKFELSKEQTEANIALTKRKLI